MNKRRTPVCEFSVVRRAREAWRTAALATLAGLSMACPGPALRPDAAGSALTGPAAAGGSATAGGLATAGGSVGIPALAPSGPPGNVTSEEEADRARQELEALAD